MLNIDDRFLGEATIDQFWFMCHLAKFMNVDATCFPSNQTLCDCTGWRISKLNEVKKSCIDAGFIKVETRYLNNRQSSNEYTVLIDRISIAVNLKGKKARQIPATNVAPYHNGDTPPATNVAPPPATLAASEVLTNKEVLTSERENAPAQNSPTLETNPALEGEFPAAAPGAPQLPPRWTEIPNSNTSGELRAYLSRFYKAYPEEWRNTKDGTPAMMWNDEKTKDVVSRFCDWALTEGLERRTLKQINARLKMWLKDEQYMSRQTPQPDTRPLRAMKVYGQ